jgi:hypothetical protein
MRHGSGGKKEKWARGSDPARLGDYAWYKDNDEKKTDEKGTKRPPAMGVDCRELVW